MGSDSFSDWLILFSVNECCACMYVCVSHVCVLRKSKEGEGSLGVGVTVSCEPSCGCWWIGPDSLPKTKQQNKTKTKCSKLLSQLSSPDFEWRQDCIQHLCMWGTHAAVCTREGHWTILGVSFLLPQWCLERNGVVRMSQHRLCLLSYHAGPILKSDGIAACFFLTQQVTCSEPKRTK